MAVATPPTQAPLAHARENNTTSGPGAPAAASAAALGAALTGIGDRWSLAVVAQLAAGPQRFSDLANACAPIARTVLTERLRRLEELNVIARRKYSETPERWNYRLTLAGAELARVCAVLADWSSRHLGDGSPVLQHVGCGHPVSPAYACDNCGPVAPRDISSTRA